MQYRKFAALAALPILFATIACAQVVAKTAGGNSASSTATSTATSTVSTSTSGGVGPVFTDLQKDGKFFVFDVVMPWGKNGTYAKLTANGGTAATTTLPANSPYAQRFRFRVGQPLDSMYTYVVSLCDTATSTDCAKSSPVNLMVRKGKAVREEDLSSEDLSVARATELSNIARTRLHDWFVAQETRAKGLMARGDSSSTTPSEGGCAARIKNVLKVTDNGTTMLLPNNVSVDGIVTAAQTFPAFCNEAGVGESLDTACARDIAAYLSYLTYFTNGNVSSPDLVMHGPLGVANMSGFDVQNFEKLFPGDSGAPTFAARLVDHPQDAYLAAMYAYMMPRSPEPDMHSALLGIWMPNAVDRARAIVPGFGATLNVATHGAACSLTSTPEGNALPLLYTNYRARLGFVDPQPTDCTGQRSFTLGGAAALPFYWQSSKEGASTECTLGVLPTTSTIFTDDGKLRCANQPTTPDRYYRAVDDIAALLARIGTGDGLADTKSLPIDARVGLGARIIGTYNDVRAHDPNTQPKDIPFQRINTLIYEGARPSATGAIEWIDPEVATHFYFAGDCVRSSCPHGLPHQFALAQQKYPLTEFTLGIGGWDGSANFSALDNDATRATFVDSVRAFLTAQPQFTGIDLAWTGMLSGTTDDKGISHRDDMVMNSIVGDLRKSLNDLAQTTGRTYHLSVSVGATKTQINASGVQRFIDKLDYVHVAAYDLHGPWDATVGHTAQLLSTGTNGDDVSVADAILALRGLQIPTKKIVVGMPAYGRMYRGVGTGTDPKLPGIGAVHHTGDAPSFVDYRSIVSFVLGKGNYQYYADDMRGAAYLFDGTNLVSYDAPDMIEKKMQYVWKDGYGGVLLADIMGDDGTLGKRILDVIGKQADKSACVMTRKPTRNLSDKSKGADVFALQTFLRCRGYLPEYVDINGNYTKPTRDAVTKFQTAEGIDPTGALGEQARAKLMLYLDPSLLPATSTASSTATSTAVVKPLTTMR